MSDEFVPYLKGDLDARQHRIYNLPDPVDNNEVATKAYVDAGGGSQPQKFVLDLAWDTPGLATGIDTGYTAAVGDVVVILGASIPEAFNGNSPYLALYKDGANSYSDNLTNFGLDTANTPIATGWDQSPVSPGIFAIPSVAAKLKVRLFDNDDDSDPGSTQGTVRIIFSVYSA